MLAKILNLKLFVVGPVSVLSVWEKVAKLANVEIVKCTKTKKNGLISYESLRGLRGYKLSHPYLTRIEDDYDNISYKGTELLNLEAENGILLVFDEFQKIKNVTMAQFAARGMVDGIKGTRSRSLFLSATPFDKPNQFYNFLNTLCLISKPVPTVQDTKKIIDKMKEINLNLTEKIINPSEDDEKMEVSRTVDRVKIPKGDLFYNLFAFVFVPEVFSSMDPPAIDVEKIVKNGFYNILNKDDNNNLMYAIEIFSKAAAQYAAALDKGDYAKAEIFFAVMMSSLVKIERAKISTLIRLGQDVLKKDPNCKVIFSCFYKESHQRIHNHFVKIGYNTGILNGDINPKKRHDIIDKFQTDSSYRVLVMQPRVGGIGVSLHDTDGRYKRYLFGIPRYEILDSHQVTGRLYRVGTKSAPEITWVYAKGGSEEVKLLNSLAMKTKVLKDVLKKQVEAGIKYPGDYPEYIEPDIKGYPSLIRPTKDDNNANDNE